jgi:hypothetical protein
MIPFYPESALMMYRMVKMYHRVKMLARGLNDAETVSAHVTM